MQPLDKNIEHVIWDWNGTLLDDVHASVCAINTMLHKRGLPRIDPDHYRNIFDFPVKNYYLTLGFNLDAEDWPAVAREYHDHYEAFAAQSPLRPGVAQLLDQALQSALPMSILSACEASILTRMVAQRHPTNAFQHIVGLSNLYAESKLDAGRKLLQTLNLPPATILLVGDTTHDYKVASAMGCRCVLVAGGHHSRSKLDSCPCTILSNLPELGHSLLFRNSPTQTNQ